MLVVCGLIASVIAPQHAVSVTVATSVVSLVRRFRSSASRDHSSLASSSLSDTPAKPAPPASVTLAWSDLRMSVGGATSASADPAASAPEVSAVQHVLRGVSGVARPGRITAVAGPSGSGKTTLLMALAGRIPRSARVDLRGRVCVNGTPADEADMVLSQNAFIPQEDHFFSELTVLETLELAAKMRLPKAMSADEKNAFVQKLVIALGLVDCKDTRVGNVKARGISGGEKKRLSVGCELISSPRLIFADEPTSQLDSFQAEKVMASLQKLARSGHTVVLSIHQPSGAVFSMCDDLILLANGQTVFQGQREEAVGHFAKMGYPVPKNTNSAEHYLTMISVDSETPGSVAESEERIAKLVAAYGTARGQADVAGDAMAITTASSGGARNGCNNRRLRPVLGKLQQLRLLLVRAFRQVTRDKKTNISRFMSALFSALTFGSIYWRMGYGQSTIQDRLGLLQVCCINAAMSALVKTLYIFGHERDIVNRERVRGTYDVLPYFSSKLLAELPVSAFFPLVFSSVVYPMVRLSGGAWRVAQFMGLITLESFTAASYGLLVGSLMPSPEAAVAVGPSSFVIFIVFGGLYVSEANVPTWLRWLPRVSIIKHAFEGLCVNELRGIEFEAKRPWDVRTGEQQLQRLGWGESTIAGACISQARVLVVNYLLTYAVLAGKAPRFQRIEDPVVVEEIADAHSVVVAEEEAVGEDAGGGDVGGGVLNHSGNPGKHKAQNVESATLLAVGENV